MPTLPPNPHPKQPTAARQPAAPLRSTDPKQLADPLRPADADPHRHREMAESFGADAALYDRARPSYPTALIDALVAAAPGRDFLDVGCGTGILSRQLQAAGCRVLGVDVDERMAAYARSTGVDAEVSPFETWDAAGRTFDALVAGMTWHWIDPAVGSAKAADVLRPGGTFAVFWYVLQPPPDLGAAFAAVQRDVLPQNPAAARAAASPLGAYEHFLDRTADNLTDAFTDISRATFPWSRTYTRDEWLDQLRTSGIAKPLADAGKLDTVLKGTGAAIDAAGGTFPLDSVAVTLTATRK
ncbi:methyltransferase family protein [Kribbella sp. VKM Ac-2571]|uniref:class I SAM-dependent methyltransferase n=1 Tax=Kribbella sp. VKM Ac-2571 TaxID=2512222 RepID=UPI0010ED0F78|nr:class I SAM-dependent methyltransferase [Kribbella sp. VKM Ac-2571]TDO52005.1 methyltransferase family protein [Kribbella sp. VKM Ac-2571]